MRIGKRFLVLLCLILSVCSVTVPAHADDNIFDIEISGGEVTIKPGNTPDLGSDITTVTEDVSEKVIDKVKSVAQAVTGVCALICLVFFFINVAKLATSGSISFQRRAAIVGILWSGAALALFGGGWFIISFFWNLFTG